MRGHVMQLDDDEQTITVSMRVDDPALDDTDLQAFLDDANAQASPYEHIASPGTWAAPPTRWGFSGS